MFKNKLLSIMLIILLVLTIIGASAFAVMTYMKKGPAQASAPTIDQILSRSVDVPEITTNLKDDAFVVITLKIQTDSKKAKTELDKRIFQVQNIVIQELSTTFSKQLKTKEGVLHTEDLLKQKINEYMKDGKVEKVYITNRVIQ